MHSGGMHGRSTRGASETDPTTIGHMYSDICVDYKKEAMSVNFRCISKHSSIVPG